MSPSLDPREVRALLLDVEGTTTRIAFVHEVLFPYARTNLKTFLARNGDDSAVMHDVEALHLERARDPDAGDERFEPRDLDDTVRYCHRLMDRDEKSTALKALQGRVWEDGYRRGDLRGDVYPDVPRAFARWRAQGRDIAIFSSGSVLAQRLLFAHSIAGDLTRFLRAYFDTSTGPKKEAHSYKSIARALELAPEAIVFLSDTIAELDAAHAAGLQTLMCIRPGSTAPGQSAHERITSFDEVLPDAAPTH